MNQESQSHRATPEQWEHVQISAGMKQQIPWATADCLLELRARVEALEAAQREAPMAELHAASAEARPAGVLVDMVEEAIITGMVDSDRQAARAAIRDMASWLEMEGYFAASRAITLEMDPT